MKTRQEICTAGYFAIAMAALLSTLEAQASAYNDGIPDEWRIEHFGSTDSAQAAPLSDPDRDGANNYLESVTGTNPTDRRSVDRSPVWVGTYIGSEVGWQDGHFTRALLNSPRDMAWDPQGRLWFTETGDLHNSTRKSNRIRIVTRFGQVTTLSGDDEPGLVEGPVAQARFAVPQTPVFDSHGNAYIADLSNHRVRKITPDGIVSTFAGSTAGYRNGVGTEAQFHTVQALCIDADDNIYVADWDNICIRKITPAGEVSLFAGIPGGRGANDGPRLEATFETPGHMAFAPNGDMFVVDWANGRLRVINPEGIVSTFVTGITYTHRVIVDDNSNVYVTWGVPGPVTFLQKYRPDGRVAWTVGGFDAVGLEDGPIDRAKFGYAFSPVLLPSGNILISDQTNHRIRYILMGLTRLLKIKTTVINEAYVTVSMETPATSAHIRYTTDGRRPGTRSNIYNGPFVADSSAVIKARLFVNDTPVSDLVTHKRR